VSVCDRTASGTKRIAPAATNDNKYVRTCPPCADLEGAKDWSARARLIGAVTGDAARSTREAALGEKLLTVRRAKTNDVHGVLACLLAAFDEYRDQYTPDAFADTVPDVESVDDRIRNMWVYVAVSDSGEIIGTLAAALTDDAEGHLRGMAVHPESQKRGVAKELLAIVLDDLRASGCKRVTLDTTPPLRKAMQFYEANGFRRTGRVSDFFGMELYEYARNLEP